MNEEILTREEIEKEYPSEWILMVDLKRDEHLKVLSARVICHSPDRDVVYRKAVDLAPLSCGFLYTGKIPKGMAVILGFRSVTRLTT